MKYHHVALDASDQFLLISSNIFPMDWPFCRIGYHIIVKSNHDLIYHFGGLWPQNEDNSKLGKKSNDSQAVVCVGSVNQYIYDLQSELPFLLNSIGKNFSWFLVCINFALFFFEKYLTRLILFQAELIKKQQEDLLRNQWEVEKLEEQRQLMEKERKKQELG